MVAKASFGSKEFGRTLGVGADLGFSIYSALDLCDIWHKLMVGYWRL